MPIYMNYKSIDELQNKFNRKFDNNYKRLSKKLNTKKFNFSIKKIGLKKSKLK